MPDAGDAWLHERLQAGDLNGAVDGVYRRHARDLRVFLRNRLDDDDAVEEVLSGVFHSLLQDLAAFRGESKLRTWLHTVTRHAVARHFQREQARRDRTRPLDDSDENRPQSGLRATYKQFIRQAYLGLDADDRQLVDQWMEGWSWAEIAGHLQATEEGVRKRFTRLMQRLAER